MTSGGMIFLYIVLIAACICLDIYLAGVVSDIAAEKGYKQKRWFCLCLGLMLPAYVIVAAMPDKELRKKQDETNILLRQILEARGMKNHPADDDQMNQNLKVTVEEDKPAARGPDNTAGSGNTAEEKRMIAEGGWKCPACGKVNFRYLSRCACGTKKPYPTMKSLG